MAVNGTRPSWSTETRYEILIGQDRLDFVGCATLDRVVAETARRYLDGAFLAQGPGVWQQALEHSWCVTTVSDNEAKVNAFVAHLHRNLKRAGLKQDVIKVNRWPVETVLVAFPEKKQKYATVHTANGHRKKNGHRRQETS